VDVLDSIQPSIYIIIIIIIQGSVVVVVVVVFPPLTASAYIKLKLRNSEQLQHVIKQQYLML